MLDSASAKPFRCERCDYTSNRSFDLRRHQQRHEKVKPLEGDVFKCSECQFMTKWKRNMRRHMLQHKKTEEVEEVGQSVEEYFVEVIQESELHEVDEDAEIPEPSINIVLSDEIDKNRRRFKCDLCRYTTNRTFDLRRHKQTHYRVKSVDGMAYKCSECQFVTKWKRNMRRHMRKHEKPPSEDEEQPLEEIIVELITEDPEPDLKAETVYSSPTQTVELTTLEPDPIVYEKRFRCNQCTYESKRLFDLRRHSHVHDKVKLIDGEAYQCNECWFVTKWKRNMRRHMQKHKATSVPDEQPFDEFVVELKSELASQEDPEVLPSLWIALPSDQG